jgi:hypothetical protein
MRSAPPEEFEEIEELENVEEETAADAAIEDAAAEE